MVILIARKFENLSNVIFDELQKNGYKVIEAL